MSTQYLKWEVVKRTNSRNTTYSTKRLREIVEAVGCEFVDSDTMIAQIYFPVEAQADLRAARALVDRALKRVVIGSAPGTKVPRRFFGLVSEVNA